MARWAIPLAGPPGFFWGWITPPVLVAIAWLIYDAIDDRLEAQTGRLWDSARRRP